MAAFDQPLPTIDLAANIKVYKPTEEETADINSFLLSPEGKIYKDLDLGMVLRFLRARDFDKEKTASLLKDHVEWMEKIKPLGISLQDVEAMEGGKKAMESGCWRYLGDSDDGSPILEIRTGLWNPHEYDIDTYEKYVAWFVTWAERVMEAHSQFIIIFDMAGWGFWMAGYLRYILRLVNIAQNHYPERLRRVLMVNAPVIFSSTWGLITPWLDPKTSAKVVFVQGQSEDAKEEIAKLNIPLSKLSENYSGDIKREDADKIPSPNYPGLPDYNQLNLNK